MGRLTGKHIILTGASGGIGKQIAIKISEEGGDLAICARSEDKLIETAKLCEANGVRVLAQKCDVGKTDEMQAFVEGAAGYFDGRVDVLINNAISINNPKPFLEHTVDDLNQSLKTGLYSTWHMMQMSFPYMKEHGGSIINFGSSTGPLGAAGYAAYAPTKEATRALTRVAAREWGAYGIRVNNVLPGVVTERIKDSMENDLSLKDYLVELFSDNPLKRMGDPYRDVAPVVLFLATDDSGYMTGQDFFVEGGATMFA